MKKDFGKEVISLAERERVPPEAIRLEREIRLAQWAQNLADEGVLHYSRSKEPVKAIDQKTYWGYYPASKVAMTDIQEVKYHAETVGATAGPEPGRPGVFLYYFSGKRLLEFLRAARPYFRGRAAEHVDLILKFGIFYVPYKTETPSPSYLSIVKPKELIKIAEKSVKITPMHPMGYPPVPPEFVEEMRRLRAEGWKLSEISEHTGYVISTVWKYVRQAEGGDQ